MDATDIDLDLDCNFEPQTRARSNTWPLRPPRELEPQSSPVGADDGSETPGGKDPLGLNAKKSGSRRNAWGNLSYADLITKAIQSSPEHRLTLSQIYDWMVQNVPFFKDKGDSTSSAGWKNSIRHNLSLHNRFMRIQNEGTGKSSWWVINPDAKPGKTPRRRAGSMETKSYEKKRGRVRKKVEALRISLENGGTLSPSLSEDYLDAFSDFRPRASSNASSCGRLSPIHAVAEPDLHDNQVPPMSPNMWSTDMNQSPTLYPGDCYSDLVDSLGDGMKLSSPETMMNNIRDPYISGTPQDYGNRPQSYLADRASKSMDNQYSHLPAPPPYPKSQQQQQQAQVGNLEYQQNFNGLRLQLGSSPGNNVGGGGGGGGGGFQPSPDLYEPIQDYNVVVKQEVIEPSTAGLPPLTSSNTLSVNTQQQQLSSPDRSQQGSPNSGSYTHLSPQPPPLVNGHQQSPLNCQLSPQQQTPHSHLPPSLQQTHHPQTTQHQQQHQSQQQQQQQQVLQQQAQAAASQASILREALTRGPLSFRSSPTTNTSSPNNYSPVAVVSPNVMNNAMMGMQSNGGGGNGSLLQLMTTGQQIRSLNETSSYAGQQLTSSTTQSCSVSSSNSVNNNNNNNNNCVAAQNAIMPSDIDVDLISGLDYDMDSVIKQELLMEGNLDFNFESNSSSTAQGQNVVH